MKTYKSFLSIAVLLMAATFLTVSCNKDDETPASEKVSYSIQASLKTTKADVTQEEKDNAIANYCTRLVSAVSSATKDNEAIVGVSSVIDDFKKNWKPCSGTVAVSKTVGGETSEIWSDTFTSD